MVPDKSREYKWRGFRGERRGKCNTLEREIESQCERKRDDNKEKDMYKHNAYSQRRWHRWESYDITILIKIMRKC